MKKISTKTMHDLFATGQFRSYPFIFNSFTGLYQIPKKKMLAETYNVHFAVYSPQVTALKLQALK